MAHDFETFAESSPDGIARLDLKGKFTYVNSTTEKIMGLAREEILGRSNLELGFPDSLVSQSERDYQKVLRTGEVVRRIFSFPLGERFYEARLVPERDGEGEIASVLVISREVTELIQVRDRLRDQRDFAEELVNTVREPMLVLDPGFMIQSANTAFEKCFLVSAAELAGKPLDEIVSGRFHSESLESLLGRILGPADEQFEGFDIEMDIPGRGLCTMRLNARQIDHLQLILLAMEDVTEQVQTIAGLEKDLRDRNQQLDVQTRQLRRMVVELSETEDRERRRLADLLHDDLQQMLVGVTFHLEIAQAQCKEDSRTELLLKESLRLLREITHKTRRLSHELSPAAFRSEGLSGGLEWLGNQMRRLHGLEVDVEVEGDVEDVADQVRILLYKAIREMLFNIVKHAEVDHARLILSRKSRHVEVIVQDHGKGFDVDAVLNRKSGQGLGLLDIRERLELLNGSLEVQSTRGKGSRFCLQVPLIQPTGGETSQVPSGAFRPAGRLRGSAIRLLVVDDHSVVREGITRLLDDHREIEVLDEAGSGAEALEKLSQREFDLVLMDYVMPGMDGVEATMEIKQKYPDVHVLGFSMLPNNEMVKRMIQAGADAFLPKSSAASELVSKILEVAGKGAKAESVE